jgi:hypothetical protein
VNKRRRRAAKATSPKEPLQEGTITFWINHKHADWSTNDKEYTFGPFTHDDDEGPQVGVSVSKKSDRSLEIRFGISRSGSIFVGHTFRGPMPEVSEKGVHIAVTWEPKEITRYANGKPISTAPFKPTVH